MPRRHFYSGFTLIELLAVIAIIAVLGSLVIVGVGKARASARQSGCNSNLRQIGVGILLYAQEHGGRLPGPLRTTFGPYPKNSDKEVLGYFLSGYMSGYEVPNAGTLRRVDVFACPAWDAEIPREAQLANNGDGRAYSLNLKAYLSSSTSPTNLLAPFGYPAQAGKPETEAKPVKTLEIVNPATTWAITDLDAVLSPSYLSQAYTPKQPVHGNVRMTLFFDGHVTSKPVSEFAVN
ncbi:MAG: type II secretion system protein [Opitutaceae bacterium]|jgi:prepilin-type N-terminal cleavage/methylation domain-containing protein/prepilin-type processing-associated H-X9-DG protein